MVIPASCLDPTAVDLLRFVPESNRPDGLSKGCRSGMNAPINSRSRLIMNSRRTSILTGYYYFTQHYLEKPFARFQAGGATLPQFGDLTDERVQQLNISHTWTIGSTAVNEARFTFFPRGARHVSPSSTHEPGARLVHFAVGRRVPGESRGLGARIAEASAGGNREVHESCTRFVALRMEKRALPSRKM